MRNCQAQPCTEGRHDAGRNKKRTHGVTNDPKQNFGGDSTEVHSEAARGRSEKAKHFTIPAIEVMSSNLDVLALCLQFFDQQNCILKECLSFTHVQRITGKY